MQELANKVLHGKGDAFMTLSSEVDGRYASFKLTTLLDGEAFEETFNSLYILGGERAVECYVCSPDPENEALVIFWGNPLGSTFRILPIREYGKTYWSFENWQCRYLAQRIGWFEWREVTEFLEYWLSTANLCDRERCGYPEPCGFIMQKF